jgi:hypothetical protein
MFWGKLARSAVAGVTFKEFWSAWGLRSRFGVTEGVYGTCFVYSSAIAVQYECPYEDTKRICQMTVFITPKD